MGSNQVPRVWPQRKSGKLELLPGSQRAANTPGYLHPVRVKDSNEIKYYFRNSKSDLQGSRFGTFQFEEAFLLIPDFFEFIQYHYDAETKKATILTTPNPNPDNAELRYVFEKLMLNLTKAGNTMLVPGAIHPCERDNEGLAGTTSNNCMQLIRSEDGNIVIMYAKDTNKQYTTDVSKAYTMKLNNYFIPLLSPDMSIWWYRIPNFIFASDDDNFEEKWGDEGPARENAEKALSIWHQDLIAFDQAIQDNPDLEDRFYVGVYQRSYFSDELQMRFTNLARLGNDGNVDVSSEVKEYDEITYNVLAPNFPQHMLGIAN